MTWAQIENKNIEIYNSWKRRLIERRTTKKNYRDGKISNYSCRNLLHLLFSRRRHIQWKQFIYSLNSFEIIFGISFDTRSRETASKFELILIIFSYCSTPAIVFKLGYHFSRWIFIGWLYIIDLCLHYFYNFTLLFPLIGLESYSSIVD